MDNDNEISTIQNPDVRLFLNEEMVSSVDNVKPSTYDFEEEYAKIKKRKSHTVSIILVSTIMVVVLSVVVFSLFIGQKDNQVDVMVDAFEDLNLQNLLNELERINVASESKKRERDMLSKNYQYTLDNLESNREAELFTVASMDLTSVVLRRENARITSFYDAEITSVTDEYNVTVAILDEDIAILQAEYDSLYDPTIFDTEVAKSNSQRAVFDLEKQNLIESFNYEIDALRQKLATQQVVQLKAQLKAIADISEKYQYDISLLDPTIEDETVNALVGQILETELIRPDFVALRENEFITKEELLLIDEAENLLTAYDFIFDYLTAIPHENNMKDYSRALENLTAFSATGYDNLFLSLMKTKRLAKERIDESTARYNNLQYGFNEYKTETEQKLSDYQSKMKLAVEKETMKNQYEAYLSFISLAKLGDGFVMNAFGRDAILVFITPIKQALFAEIQPVYIFNGSSKALLGQGLVIKSADGYYLNVEDTALAQRIFMDDIISLKPTL